MKRGVKQGNPLPAIVHRPLLESSPSQGFMVLDTLDNILIMKLTNWVIERRLGICLGLYRDDSTFNPGPHGKATGMSMIIEASKNPNNISQHAPGCRGLTRVNTAFFQLISIH